MCVVHKSIIEYKLNIISLLTFTRQCTTNPEWDFQKESTRKNIIINRNNSSF